MGDQTKQANPHRESDTVLAVDVINHKGQDQIDAEFARISEKWLNDSEADLQFTTERGGEEQQMDSIDMEMEDTVNQGKKVAQQRRENHLDQQRWEKTRFRQKLVEIRGKKAAEKIEKTEQKFNRLANHLLERIRQENKVVAPSKFNQLLSLSLVLSHRGATKVSWIHNQLSAEFSRYNNEQRIHLQRRRSRQQEQKKKNREQRLTFKDRFQKMKLKMKKMRENIGGKFKIGRKKKHTELEKAR